MTTQERGAGGITDQERCVTCGLPAHSHWPERNMSENTPAHPFLAPAPQQVEDDERMDFGHDEEIGALFEAYDRLVRWEEHDSRLDAVEPVVERAAARGRIVAYIANEASRASTPPLIRADYENPPTEAELAEAAAFIAQAPPLIEGDRERLIRYESALREIKDGRIPQVCPEYEICAHEGCRASYEAYAIADAALAPAPIEEGEER